MSCFWKKSIKIGLMLGVVLAALKILLVGYDVDEQYAISMAYRFFRGDVLLKDMWEPHQTSAFFIAILLWPYYRIMGRLDGIVLYLRFCGLLVHLGVCALLYRYLMKDGLCGIEDREKRVCYSLLITGIQFLTFPKLMFLPEFSNMQVWFLLLSMLFLLRHRRERKEMGHSRYLVLAGVFMMLEVLTYPSTILAFVLALIFLIYDRDKWWWFVFPCVLGAVLLGIYLMLHMNIAEMMQYVPHIVQDGSHATTWMEKISDNLWSVVEILKFFGMYAVIAVMLSLGSRRLQRISEISFGLLFFLNLLAVTCVGQILIWVLGKNYPNYPSVEYFFVLVAGLLLGIRKKTFRTQEFYLLVLVPLGAFLGVVGLTNHPLLVSAPFLGICVTGVWVLLLRYGNRHTVLQAVMVVWLVTLIFGRGYLVRMTGGTHHTVFDYVNIMKDGPAKGIIADYNAITRYKECLDMVNGYLPENSKVFYAGENTDIYLMKELEVCVPSTISTPTFDEKIKAYWELHPNKMPEYIVCEHWVLQAEQENYLLQFISENCESEPMIGNHYMVLYKVKK